MIHAEANEPYVRSRWESAKKELTGTPLAIALQVERLMKEFDPPVWEMSRAHFVQTVVATSNRVESSLDDRSKVAQVVRRHLLGERVG